MFRSTEADNRRKKRTTHERIETVRDLFEVVR